MIGLKGLESYSMSYGGHSMVIQWSFSGHSMVIQLFQVI